MYKGIVHWSFVASVEFASWWSKKKRLLALNNYIESKIAQPKNETLPSDSSEANSSILTQNFAYTDALVFQKEAYVSSFEQEPVYDLDSFKNSSEKIEKTLTPPPNFQDQLNKFPQEINAAFKRILNAEIVGIWPIKTSNFLKSKNS